MSIDTIWKFPVKLKDRQTIEMPMERRLLHVGRDAEGEFCIWAAVRSDARTAPVEIIIAGTGQKLPHVGSFLGTIIAGVFVWHVFTGPSDAIDRTTEFHYLTKDNGNG